VEAELFPELTNRQHRSVLADGVDANVTETDAVQALGRGQLAEVLDEAVDGLRGELVAAAEGTEAVLHDPSLEALTLDDVDVLIGAVAAPDAAGTDVHVGSTVSERAPNVNISKCCHYAFRAQNRRVRFLSEYEERPERRVQTRFPVKVELTTWED